MLHSYFLALKLKVTSITVWCRMLRETPPYAILSGFSFGDTPGVGTFMISFPALGRMVRTTVSRKWNLPKEKRRGIKLPMTLPALLPSSSHYFKSTLSSESDSNSAQFCHRLLIKINNSNRQICINKISSLLLSFIPHIFYTLFQVRISLPFYVYFLFAPLFILFKNFLSWVSLHFMRILHQSNL